MEAGAFHSQTAAIEQRGAAGAGVHGKIGALRRLAILREVPQAEIYEHWRKTPMANVVRDPREHPEAIIPDLATNTIAKFTKDDVALVYGSVWKQRYFTKRGDDYFPEPAQWDVDPSSLAAVFRGKGTDWWEPFYPPDNMQRPTGPTCDGCHSVDYNIHTKQVAEWNVGCEKCHGPGSEHMEHPTRGNILNPARMDYVASERHLHPVPFARASVNESHRR